MKIKLKRILLYVTGTLAILSAFLFLAPETKSMAAERTVVLRSGDKGTVTIDTKGTDIPEEIKSPAQKLANLFGWFMIWLGALAILIGSIMIAFNSLTGGGHPGSGAVGFKVMIIGIVVVLLPIIINWIFPQINLL